MSNPNLTTDNTFYISSFNNSVQLTVSGELEVPASISDTKFYGVDYDVFVDLSCSVEAFRSTFNFISDTDVENVDAVLNSTDISFVCDRDNFANLLVELVGDGVNSFDVSVNGVAGSRNLTSPVDFGQRTNETAWDAHIPEDFLKNMAYRLFNHESAISLFDNENAVLADISNSVDTSFKNGLLSGVARSSVNLTFSDLSGDAPDWMESSAVTDELGSSFTFDTDSSYNENWVDGGNGSILNRISSGEASYGGGSRTLYDSSAAEVLFYKIYDNSGVRFSDLSNIRLDADSNATTDRVRYRMPLFVGDNIVLTMTVKMASEQLTLTNQTGRCEDRVYMVRIKLTDDLPA